ncbi:MAG: Na+/H+ antiporter NhaA [Acidobacteria bacterium]|nr:Na+/H+ antiporter NhaA [Acidobacteriota bacterium]
MGVVRRRLSKTFSNFFDSEKAGGLLLVVCTVVSLLVTNSFLGAGYLHFWHTELAGMSVELWINDGLMAIFFLLIGLELERELKVGELSDVKNALLPIFAALGGIALPALIHFILNRGSATQSGIGIPMATDIAFALGALALLGKRVPASLKVFLAALAVIDDLGAIVVIAVFYTAKLSTVYLFGALLVFGALFLLKKAGVVRLAPYLLGGVLLWFLMLKSGVHATIAGVLLAFAIPFSATDDDERSPSYRLEHFLHKPVAFVILPVFALCNTGIVLGADALQSLTTANSAGIIGGLVFGKPLGIFLACLLVVGLGICRLPLDLNWKHIFGAGILGGIGFTMSIFITNLAFPNDTGVVNASKMSILLASLVAGTTGFLWLKLFGQPTEADEDPDDLDFETT